MAKWTVWGTVPVGVRMIVEADNEEDAMQAAYLDFPGLTGYAGNGGIDQLVGVNDRSVSLDADGGEVEFTEAEKA